MNICDSCAHSEYHGFPPEGAPSWEVGTVYHWCPIHNDHKLRTDCEYYEEGKLRMFDKRGRLMRKVGA